MVRRRALAEKLSEWRERKAEILAEKLDGEPLVRFAYVPFVVARLVWDYADSITDMAAYLRISETKALSRTVKELRRQYEHECEPYILFEQSDEGNMYAYEEGVGRITRQMLVNITADLHSEYPGRGEDYVQFLAAVYQCGVTLKALLAYCAWQGKKVEKILELPIGRYMPGQLYRLNELIPMYVGDKPVSERLTRLLQEYVETFVTQMSLIRINEIEEIE